MTLSILCQMWNMHALSNQCTVSLFKVILSYSLLSSCISFWSGSMEGLPLHDHLLFPSFFTNFIQTCIKLKHKLPGREYPYDILDHNWPKSEWHSLIWVYISHKHNVWTLKIPQMNMVDLWSNCMDVLVGLSLHCGHMLKGHFVFGGHISY